MTEPDRTILCPLHRAAQELPDGPALICGHRQLTFRDLERLTRHYAEMFRAVEPPPGTYMLFHQRNRIELPAALIACWRVQLTAVLLNKRYPLPAALDAVSPDAEPQFVYFAGDKPEPGCDIPPAIELDTWPLETVSTGRTLPQIAHEQPATVMFTSGSTGTPKAVLHSYGNHYYSALGSNENIIVGPGDRWLLSLPLYHVGGLAILFRCLLGRAAMVLPEADDNLANVIADQQITHVSLVAAQLKRLVESLEESNMELPLKAVLLGGGPTPEWLVERARNLGLPLFRSYGLTEMASQVVTSDGPNSPHRIVLPHRELTVSPKSEILVRGKTRFLGYVTADGMAQPFSDDGWFATGDTGEMRPDGLKVLGRIDNMWVQGGENVCPEEIEKALMSLEGIERAIVVPIDDAEFGKRPVAFVAGNFDPGELETTLRDILPGYLIPVRFVRWPDEEPGAMKPNRGRFAALAARTMRESGG